MTSLKMKRKLEQKLENPNYRTSFNRDKDVFRIEWKESKQGINIKLPSVIAKYNVKGETAIDELVEHIEEALTIMNEEYQLTGNEKNIFPVIRSTSFQTKTNRGEQLVTTEHTAETRIFYALDLGNSYRLIDKISLEEVGWSAEQLHEMALFNLRRVDMAYNTDEVHGNMFYFIATQDGYDASRILNESFLKEMENKCEGQLVVAVPHQDVFILADVKNDAGYDIMAQMCMKFFTEGRVPITSLAFIYENNQLEPIFIMARNKPKKK